MHNSEGSAVPLFDLKSHLSHRWMKIIQIPRNPIPFFDTSKFLILQLQKFSYNEDLHFFFLNFFLHFINTPEETL